MHSSLSLKLVKANFMCCEFLGKISLSKAVKVDKGFTATKVLLLNALLVTTYLF